MSVQTDNQVKLSGGRSLGYAEYGDPQGQPVLYFHGLPSSRLELNRPAIDEIATRFHARLIALDRPGIGLSDFWPYTIAAWPDIVIEFADRLNIARFAVLGFSGGGKYVAACAWKIPQRLTVAGLVSSVCPFDLPGARATLSQQDKQLYGLADKTPWLFRLMLWKIARDARRNPASIFSLFSEMSEPDKMALARPDVKQVFEQMVVEAFRQGTRGAALDWRLEARPWGFVLQDIRTPVYIWHGEADRLVPIEQGRILAKTIPDAHASFLPNEGHTLIVNHFDELLGAIVGPQA